MNRALVAALLLLSLVAAASCTLREEVRGQPVSGLDRKLARFAYIEDGDLITLIVSVNATRYREGEAYVPFEIALANHGIKRLQLSRESFELIDETGNRYPLATPRELIAGYSFLDADIRLAELEGLTFDKFAALTRYRTKFSPTRAGSFHDRTGRARYVESTELIRDNLILPRYGFVVDMLYFPAPADGLLGKQFELFVDSPNLEDPIFVRFQVPE